MLIAVADTGSFSKAALALDSTQSRISHAIGELERSVGARLFERAHAGSVPTVAGDHALNHARQILALANAMLAPGTDAAGVVGVVRLACFRSMVTHVVPYVLTALARLHPSIMLDIDDSCADADAVAEAVVSGRADVGLGCPPYDDALLAYPLLADDYILLVPATYTLSVPLRWEQLGALPLIAPINRRTGAAIEALRTQGMRAKLARRLTSDSSIAALVANGRGFAVMPRLSVLPLAAGVRIVDPPLRQQRHIASLAQPAKARERAVKAVLRVLRDPAVLAQLPAYRAGLCGLN